MAKIAYILLCHKDPDGIVAQSQPGPAQLAPPQASPSQTGNSQAGGARAAALT